VDEMFSDSKRKVSNDARQLSGNEMGALKRYMSGGT
jgi:hypothetical protein